MADNTVTFVLNGDVPLEEFAKAIANFTELVRALSAECDASLDWIVSDLSVSSASATAMAHGDERKIEAVVSGYADVGASLEAGSEIRHSERVKTAGRKIISITDRRVSTAQFDTASSTNIVQLRQPENEPAAQGALKEGAPVLVHLHGASFGAVRGRIQTLTNRGSLRFTLFDLLYDKAVSCYIAEGKQEEIRGMWGKLATVEGMVTRDPATGRPLSIRQVETITQIPEALSPFEYQEARGAAPSLSGLSPEEAIRRVRDDY